MFYCVIVRFKQNKFISSKINDNVKQIYVSRLVSMGLNRASDYSNGAWPYVQDHCGCLALLSNFMHDFIVRCTRPLRFIMRY